MFSFSSGKTVQVSSRIVTYIVTYHRSYQILGRGGIMAYMILFFSLLHWSEEEPGCRGFSIAIEDLPPWSSRIIVLINPLTSKWNGQFGGSMHDSMIMLVRKWGSLSTAREVEDDYQPKETPIMMP